MLHRNSGRKSLFGDFAFTFCDVARGKNTSFEPDSNQRPMDVCSVGAHYSPPLYQLSYRRCFVQLDRLCQYCCCCTQLLVFRRKCCLSNVRTARCGRITQHDDATQQTSMAESDGRMDSTNGARQTHLHSTLPSEQHILILQVIIFMAK